jgi:hypothetical protein
VDIDQVFDTFLLEAGSLREPFQVISKLVSGLSLAYESNTGGAPLLRNPGPMGRIGHLSSRSASISSPRNIATFRTDAFVLSPSAGMLSFPVGQA